MPQWTGWRLMTSDCHHRRTLCVGSQDADLPVLGESEDRWPPRTSEPRKSRHDNWRRYHSAISGALCIIHIRRRWCLPMARRSPTCYGVITLRYEPVTTTMLVSTKVLRQLFTDDARPHRGQLPCLVQDDVALSHNGIVKLTVTAAEWGYGMGRGGRYFRLSQNSRG
jgi:hypothetical protein